MDGKELAKMIIENATKPTELNISEKSSIHFTRYTDLELLDEFNLEEVLDIEFINDFEGLVKTCNEVRYILKKHFVYMTDNGMYPRSIFDDFGTSFKVIDKLYSGKFTSVCDDDYVVAYCLKSDYWKLYRINGRKQVGLKLIHDNEK